MKNPIAANFSTPQFGRRGVNETPGQDRVPPLVNQATIVDHLTARTAATAAKVEKPSPTTSRRAAGMPRRRRQDGFSTARADRARVLAAARQLQTKIVDQLDTQAVSGLSRAELAEQLQSIVGEVLTVNDLQMNQVEQRDLVTMLLNEMVGLGPIEPLLSDETVTDILVNGAENVYVERGGKLELTDIKFRDNAHVMDMAIRIANRVGRRIDEFQPYVDARLSDGSRVNIITPPLALHGPTISIRKFSRKPITLDSMVENGNLSSAMATLLSVAAHSRLNIIFSGGTGAGKTTLLNALSRLIDPAERIITIEDAAELQLQQPHVVPLETRMVNIEGKGEVTIRDLVRNALRMRPDRIILGEVRGAEALDMLQAMNTGHDGSLCTIHANKPRDALTRLEHMVAMSGVELPTKVIRAQIASAVNMIVQIARMRDGVRRITHISELLGLEGDVVTMQDLYTLEATETAGGRVDARFVSTGFRPKFTERAQLYGLDRLLLDSRG